MRLNRIVGVALAAGLMAETIPKKDAILPDDNPHVPGDHSPFEPVREVVYTNTSSYSPMLSLEAMNRANQCLLEIIAKAPAPFHRTDHKEQKPPDSMASCVVPGGFGF